MDGDPVGLAKTAAALSKPLVKLIEVFESGVGAVSQPVLLVLNTYAEGRAKLIREGNDHRLRMLRERNKAELKAAKETANVRALPAGGETPTASDIEVLFQDDPVESVAVTVMQSEQAAKRRGNLFTIVGEAADNLPSEVRDEPVDPDWVARFFSSAQDVSTEELQAIWGRILAGEVTKPGSIPLRTLDVLRNLTREEAKLFLRFVAGCMRLGPNDDEIFRIVGCSGLAFTELLQLEEAGLVDPSYRPLSWFHDETASPPPAGTEDLIVLYQPVKMRFFYLSGHTLVVRSAGLLDPLKIQVVRPAGLPLLRVMSPSFSNTANVEADVAVLKKGGALKLTVFQPGEEPPAEEWKFANASSEDE